MTNKSSRPASESTDKASIVTESLFNKHKNLFIYGTLIILVLIVGGILYYNYVVQPREARAEEMIFRGQQYFQAEEYEKALNGDGQVYKGFLSVADEFGSTKAGNLARLYAGLCYAETGKYQEATNYLKAYKDCGDALISPAALAALGNCYVELGQVEDGADALVKAAQKADCNSLSPLFYMQAGQLYESLNQNDKAIECYQHIKTNYVNSAYHSDIDKYIERASK